MFDELPRVNVYQLIELGPVVLLTTANRHRPNVMTLSLHMMVDFMPPLIACIVSSGDFSFAGLKAASETVIAIPAVHLAEKVVRVGNCSGRDTDKVAISELTPVPAEYVKAPLIAECFANLECRVVDTRLASRYNLFVVEVAKAWVDPKQSNPRTIHYRRYGAFSGDGETMQFVSRMP